MHHIIRFIAAITSTALLAACGGGSGSSTGTLNLSVTDAPIDGTTNVWVEFTGVELKPQNGAAIQIDYDPGDVKKIDLLDLQGSLSEPLISNATIAAGTYNWIRLKVNTESGTLDSYIVLDDGNEVSLRIPSGNQTGLQLNTPFTITAGGVSNLTVDFDLRKSVIKPVGQPDYILKPSLKIVDNSQIGQISGTVDSTLFEESHCGVDADGSTGTGAAVYLYSGAGATTGDSGSADEPLTSALIALNVGSGDLEYEIGFVEAGNYTIAFTCDASADDPESEEIITIELAADIAVLVGQTTAHNFAAP